MAQLNPNFEIDFSDINSYEQIQLINDTQLAKENLLMHRAYKEPSDDEIIRNHFSSFTFVDFCPKLYTASTSALSASSETQASGSRSLRYYEMETFSDLFDRINSWLKLNKDWRVVSMETLVYDCTSQFNHFKSSIHSSYLPQNTRGLRLFLSPSKSRFSGPQKIGCINVVPRKVSGSYRSNEPVVYETLDQILKRLNELLLTQPIKGRILSVETITLPMVDGYVNTECNYFMDSRLNLLNERTYNLAHAAAAGSESPATLAGHTLIDILRVYYEFGPTSCGLVNLIDFIPRFYSPTQTLTTAPPTTEETQTPTSSSDGGQQRQVSAASVSAAAAAAATAGGPTMAPTESNARPIDGLILPTSPTASPTPSPLDSSALPASEKIVATESLTRLVRRSLTWFECERKLILKETAGGSEERSDLEKAVNLKVCNVQIRHKTMLKGQLMQVKASNALSSTNTRQMAHERVSVSMQPLVCQRCPSAAYPIGVSSSAPLHDWCSHLVEQSQPYELKFVRLAYVVPVQARYTIPFLRPLHSSEASMRRRHRHRQAALIDHDLLSSSSSSSSSSLNSESGSSSSKSGTSSKSASSLANSSIVPDSSNSKPHNSQQAAGFSVQQQEAAGGREVLASDSNDSAEIGELGCGNENEDDDDLFEAGKQDERAKRAALDLVLATNERHLRQEEENQLQQGADRLDDSPIGQLSYRLFAPCQLVNSSSCFSINPVNSSSPLARRGSLDLNGGGLSSSSAHPSTLLLAATSSLSCSPSSSSNHLSGAGSSSANHSHEQQDNRPQQVVTSFGAFFPALAHDVLPTTSSPSAASSEMFSHLNRQSGSFEAKFQAKVTHTQATASSSAASRFTTNEFESVEAIRRRMEIYVTTNSMKVIAGETLIVNLSDVLSCLSTAIEQTIVGAPFCAQRKPSTWVSVYVLYAAVDEPQLPGQLLAQQKMRELALIDEDTEAEAEANEAHKKQEEFVAATATNASAHQLAVLSDDEERCKQLADSIFDDDFKGELNSVESAERSQQQQPTAVGGETMAMLKASTSSQSASSSIHIEQNPVDSSLRLYNSAYDRTVALPTQPENSPGSLEPIDLFGSQADCLWLEEADLISGRDGSQLVRSSKRKKQSKRGKRKSYASKREDTACSII